MSSINPETFQGNLSKLHNHPDAIKISVDSFFKIYDKNHDGIMNKS
jgi:hypothetical protein